MRMNLMASIQGSGLSKLKKSSSSESVETSPVTPKPVEASPLIQRPGPPAVNLADAIKSKSAMVNLHLYITMFYANSIRCRNLGKILLLKIYQYSLMQKLRIARLVLTQLCYKRLRFNHYYYKYFLSY
jgi:hypothetical protein